MNTKFHAQHELTGSPKTANRQNLRELLCIQIARIIFELGKKRKPAKPGWFRFV